jgi:hypothetical protein
MIQISGRALRKRSAAWLPLLLTFRSNGEVFGVYRRHKGHEDLVIIVRDIVIASILADRRI